MVRWLPVSGPLSLRVFRLLPLLERLTPPPSPAAMEEPSGLGQVLSSSRASPNLAGSGGASFSDSDDSSSVCCGGGPTAESVATPEVAALRRLSAHLEALLRADDLAFCADAFICVGSDAAPPLREVPVHRCVLSARSPFFRALFSGEEGKGKEKFNLQDLVPGISLGYDALMMVVEYIYSSRVGPLPDGVCDCVDELCLHIACRPAIDFLVQVLCVASTFQISELVSLYQRHLLDVLETVDSDDLLVILSASGNCGGACERLTRRCIELAGAADLDAVAMEKALPPEVVKQVLELRAKEGPSLAEFPDKHARRIQKALDSDDVELVRMLLMEARTTLDDACALHYAVAYCDAKITMELLEIGVADVNRRDQRGQTVLHLAARRKEPNIIVSLLTKGASTGDLTREGRNALQITKRLTRYADYYRETEQGMPTPKDKLCIEILEQAEQRAPQPGEASVTLATAGEDARIRLLYLENRVALARLLFPMEAKVAMDIAQVDGTLEFTLGTGVNLGGNATSQVDLNETPFNIKKEHIVRIRALSKTVELGKRFFPRCSKVLDKIMDDEGANGMAWTATREEQFMRKRRYQELQNIVGKAFSEDKQENDRCALSSSSCSSTVLVGGIREKIGRK